MLKRRKKKATKASLTWEKSRKKRRKLKAKPWM